MCAPFSQIGSSSYPLLTTWKQHGTQGWKSLLTCCQPNRNSSIVQCTQHDCYWVQFTQQYTVASPATEGTWLACKHNIYSVHFYSSVQFKWLMRMALHNPLYSFHPYKVKGVHVRGRLCGCLLRPQSPFASGWREPVQDSYLWNNCTCSKQVGGIMEIVWRGKHHGLLYWVAHFDLCYMSPSRLCGFYGCLTLKLSCHPVASPSPV